jgi:uncharacterized protein (DUF427 family)
MESIVNHRKVFMINTHEQRVDVLQSARHIRVEFKGVEIANTNMARLLYETGLRIRTYIPKTHCRLDLMEPSDITMQCPYKVCSC